MGAPHLAPSSSSRLRREDYQRTKHDSSFSKWQVLIGPWDWENHKLGKEGAERYRVANLPSVSGPGLYEIGVAVWLTDSGRDLARLEPDRIVVVYLGQAENVRARLQHYGRSGSHLVHAYDQRTVLFQDIFFRGYPIVYRWALMKNKSEAEKTEAELLDTFDYAWNKVSNGARRPNDVLTKIEKVASRNAIVPRILNLIKSFGEKKVGITINANKPNNDPDKDRFNPFDRVLKFGRSQPRLVSANPHDTSFEPVNQVCHCGVTLSDGSICSKPPVEGRKRCGEHKGRRLASRARNLTFVPNQEELQANKNSVNDEFIPICGVIVPKLDGSLTPCEKPAYPGRRRCLEHQGMRVNRVISLSSPSCLSKLDGADGYCGVALGNGRFCDAKPVQGRKRCEEHKGKRVGHFIPNIVSS